MGTAIVVVVPPLLLFDLLSVLLNCPMKLLVWELQTINSINLCSLRHTLSKMEAKQKRSSSRIDCLIKEFFQEQLLLRGQLLLIRPLCGALNSDCVLVVQRFGRL